MARRIHMIPSTTVVCALWLKSQSLSTNIALELTYDNIPSPEDTHYKGGPEGPS